MKAAAEEDSSFVFKINDRPQRTVESKRIMVDTGATSHIIIFTNPSTWSGYDTRSIFKRSLKGLNSEFSFS